MGGEFEIFCELLGLLGFASCHYERFEGLLNLSS